MGREKKRKKIIKIPSNYNVSARDYTIQEKM